MQLTKPNDESEVGGVEGVGICGQVCALISLAMEALMLETLFVKKVRKDWARLLAVTGSMRCFAAEE